MLISTDLLLLKQPYVLHVRDRDCVSTNSGSIALRTQEVECSLPSPAHWPKEQLSYTQLLAVVAQTVAHTLFHPRNAWNFPAIAGEGLTPGGAASLYAPSKHLHGGFSVHTAVSGTSYQLA